MNVRNQVNQPESGTRPDPFAFDGGVTAAIDLTDHLAPLDKAHCIELLETTPVGRIGFTAGGRPMVLPVNFAWFEDSVVFRSLDGQKLAAAAEAQEVCFEVDHWDTQARTGWSVVVRGQARQVTQWAEREQLENIGLVPWARDAWRHLWVRIEPTEMSGRRLR